MERNAILPSDLPGFISTYHGLVGLMHKHLPLLLVISLFRNCLPIGLKAERRSYSGVSSELWKFLECSSAVVFMMKHFVSKQDDIIK